MIVRPGVLLVLVLAGAALPVAFSTRRLQASQSRLAEASARLERVGEDARHVVELRTREERVADRKRPKQDVIARVNAVLGATGIPASQFGGLRLESDSDIPGASGGARYRRQSMAVDLKGLTVAELTAFLTEWRASQLLWTPSRLDLTHLRDRKDGDRYDAGIVITATYVAD